MRIDFATTCKNREQYLKHTLPANLQLIADCPNVDIVLLNYNSSGDLSEWIKPYLSNQQLNYFEERTQEYFNMSHAKNMAHRLADADYVINLDSDNYLTEEYLQHVLKVVKLGAEFISCLVPRRGFGLDGRIGCTKELFGRMRGYDEMMQGWGGDDWDFSDRCLNSRCKRAYPVIRSLDSVIMHTNKERSENFPNTCKSTSETMYKNHELAKDVNRLVNPHGFGCGVVYDNNNNQIILN